MQGANGATAGPAHGKSAASGHTTQQRSIRKRPAEGEPDQDVVPYEPAPVKAAKASKLSFAEDEDEDVS